MVTLKLFISKRLFVNGILFFKKVTIEVELNFLMTILFQKVAKLMLKRRDWTYCNSKCASPYRTQVTQVTCFTVYTERWITLLFSVKKNHKISAGETSFKVNKIQDALAKQRD